MVSASEGRVTYRPLVRDHSLPRSGALYTINALALEQARFRALILKPVSFFEACFILKLSHF
jgi:hypothetical protein